MSDGLDEYDDYDYYEYDYDWRYDFDAGDEDAYSYEDMHDDEFDELLDEATSLDDYQVSGSRQGTAAHPSLSLPKLREEIEKVKTEVANQARLGIESRERTKMEWKEELEKAVKAQSRENTKKLEEQMLNKARREEEWIRKMKADWKEDIEKAVKEQSREDTEKLKEQILDQARREEESRQKMMEWKEGLNKLSRDKIELLSQEVLCCAQQLEATTERLAAKSIGTTQHAARLLELEIKLLEQHTAQTQMTEILKKQVEDWKEGAKSELKSIQDAYEKHKQELVDRETKCGQLFREMQGCRANLKKDLQSHSRQMEEKLKQELSSQNGHKKEFRKDMERLKEQLKAEIVNPQGEQIAKLKKEISALARGEAEHRREMTREVQVALEKGEAKRSEMTATIDCSTQQKVEMTTTLVDLQKQLDSITETQEKTMSGNCLEVQVKRAEVTTENWLSVMGFNVVRGQEEHKLVSNMGRDNTGLAQTEANLDFLEDLRGAGMDESFTPTSLSEDLTVRVREFDCLFERIAFTDVEQETDFHQRIMDISAQLITASGHVEGLIKDAKLATLNRGLEVVNARVIRHHVTPGNNAVPLSNTIQTDVKSHTDDPCNHEADQLRKGSGDLSIKIPEGLRSSQAQPPHGANELDNESVSSTSSTQSATMRRFEAELEAYRLWRQKVGSKSTISKVEKNIQDRDEKVKGRKEANPNVNAEQESDAIIALPGAWPIFWEGGDPTGLGRDRSPTRPKLESQSTGIPMNGKKKTKVKQVSDGKCSCGPCRRGSSSAHGLTPVSMKL